MAHKSYFKTMDNKPRSALDALNDMRARQEEPEGDPWEWQPSDEMRKILESMGIYGLMAEQLRVIEKKGTSKRDIDMAKSKLDALSKSITTLKAATAIHKDSGTEDNETGVSRVSIDLTPHYDIEEGEDE